MNFQGFHYKPDGSEMASKGDISMMQDMYDAITQAFAWDFMKIDPGDGGFMFCKDPMMDTIRSHMKLLHYHSGSSFGLMMRYMQQLACLGEQRFRELHFKA